VKPVVDLDFGWAFLQRRIPQHIGRLFISNLSVPKLGTACGWLSRLCRRCCASHFSSGAECFEMHTILQGGCFVGALLSLTGATCRIRRCQLGQPVGASSVLPCPALGPTLIASIAPLPPGANLVGHGEAPPCHPRRPCPGPYSQPPAPSCATSPPAPGPCCRPSPPCSAAPATGPPTPSWPPPHCGLSGGAPVDPPYSASAAGATFSRAAPSGAATWSSPTSRPAPSAHTTAAAAAAGGRHHLAGLLDSHVAAHQAYVYYDVTLLQPRLGRVCSIVFYATFQSGSSNSGYFLMGESLGNFWKINSPGFPLGTLVCKVCHQLGWADVQNFLL
jgi:hypothetical protein